MSLKKSQSHWLPLADMMTGLMLVFLFISVIYIAQIQKREQQRASLVTKYAATKQELYKELDLAFRDKYDAWDMELDKDLTIKFANPDVLFETDSHTITPKYAAILNDFIPTYIDIISKEKYADSIREVRIEGHTAATSAMYKTYIDTIRLSQSRSTEILSYILSNVSYQQLDDARKSKLKFWFTANGLGEGRTLDEDRKYTRETGKPVSNLSRRVEFRIVTTSEELVDKILTEYKK